MNHILFDLKTNYVCAKFHSDILKLKLSYTVVSTPYNREKKQLTATTAVVLYIWAVSRQNQQSVFALSVKIKKKHVNTHSLFLQSHKYKNEPRHDKTNIMALRPAWIQTSMRIRAVWSGSMLIAYRLYYK
jgi:hypothetical protein